MNTYHICFSSDNNYAQHLGVTIASILTTNPKHNFHFYVLDGGISEKNKNKLFLLKKIKQFELDFVPMDENEFSGCPVPPNSHISLATFYRFKILSLFPNLEKILYLDCDLLVLKDLKPLFEINLNKSWMALCADYFSDKLSVELKIKDRPYYNAGVIMFNLKECRKNNLEKKLFQYAISHPDLRYGDQDVINMVVGAHILTLPQSFNCQFQPFVCDLENRILSKIKEITILHYTSGLKPWKTNSQHQLNDYYFKFLKHTPWKGEYNKIMLKKMKRFLFQKIKTEKTKKIKIFSITVIKKIRKKDYSKKILFLGIPVWKSGPDKWRLKYEQLLQEEYLFHSDITALQKQLEALEGIKLLKKAKK